jgi:hypothetical protein
MDEKYVKIYREELKGKRNNGNGKSNGKDKEKKINDSS